MIVFSSLADSFTFDLQVVERSERRADVTRPSGAGRVGRVLPDSGLRTASLLAVRSRVDECVAVPARRPLAGRLRPGLRTGSNLRPIVRDFGDVRHPSFAPDGRIVFSANPEGAFRLFVVDPDDEQPEPVEITDRRAGREGRRRPELVARRPAQDCVRRRKLSAVRPGEVGTVAELEPEARNPRPHARDRLTRRVSPSTRLARLRHYRHSRGLARRLCQGPLAACERVCADRSVAGSDRVRAQSRTATTC